jgi:hypothetical protein
MGISRLKRFDFSVFIDKKYMRNIIKRILREMGGEVDEAVYPEGFDMGVFSGLKTFKARIDYVQSRLVRLGSGSSRIVYKIDDITVLKLAKNAKGIAQNEMEHELSAHGWYGDIVAEVYEVVDDYRWIEMQWAKKMSVGDFERILGVPFSVYKDYLHNIEYAQGRRRHGGRLDIPERYEKIMREKEFFSDIERMAGDYDMALGDFNRPSSYGVVRDEDGTERVVLVDYGASWDIIERLYYKKR